MGIEDELKGILESLSSGKSDADRLQEIVLHGISQIASVCREAEKLMPVEPLKQPDGLSGQPLPCQDCDQSHAVHHRKEQ